MNTLSALLRSLSNLVFLFMLLFKKHYNTQKRQNHTHFQASTLANVHTTCYCITDTCTYKITKRQTHRNRLLQSRKKTGAQTHTDSYAHHLYSLW